MAIGNSQYLAPIIDDTKSSTRTTYSSDKLDSLMKKFGASAVEYFLTIAETAPTITAVGDKYYKESTGLIYEATSTTAWNTGSNPVAHVLYVDQAHGKIYIYYKSKMKAVSGSVTISAEDNNAVQEKTDGLYVEDLSEQVKRINIAQKTVNENMSYLSASIGDNNKITNNAPITITKKYGNIEIDNNKIKLEADKTYNICVSISQVVDSGNTDTKFELKDITNNIILAQCEPFSKEKNEFSDVMTVNYSPNIDCELEIISRIYSATPTINNSLSTLTVTEVGRVITIDPVNYIDTNQGIQDASVGQIIEHMGTKAPKHYLVADGSILNIADYPYLAQHFIDDFGSVNHWGGDGVTTFKLPDLQGEFLRGAGTNSHTAQGNGANVGEHQDGTEENSLVYGGSSNSYVTQTFQGTNYIGPKNVDKVVAQSSTWVNINKDQSGSQASPSISRYTSRPTNTSVLMCIKYEPTYFVGSINGQEIREDLISAPITKVNTGTAGMTAHKTVHKLAHPITDYDYIEVTACCLYNNDNGELGKQVMRIPVDKIVYESNSYKNCYQINVNDSANVIGIWFGFKDKDNLYIERTSRNTTVVATGYHSMQIMSIVGIKTNYSIGGTVGGSNESLSAADIEAAINSTIDNLNSEEDE